MTQGGGGTMAAGTMAQSQQSNQGNFDYTAPEINYMHYREYDFDESDRPVIYPQEGYGKFLFPVQRQVSQSYSTGKDWEWVCPKFIPYVSPEAENK